MGFVLSPAAAFPGTGLPTGIEPHQHFAPLLLPLCSYGLHNAYFWVVSCLIMYTVALPGYAHDR